MAILEFDVLPTVFKGGAFIIEADEQDFRSPAEAVAYMNGRGFATGHRGIATGADMDFVKVSAIAGKHRYSSSQGKRLGAVTK
jgi:hypothetical protein